MNFDDDEWDLDYEGQQRCVVCARGADHTCSRCKDVYYCGKECQVYDWHEDGHKQECQELETLEDEFIGRRHKGGGEHRGRSHKRGRSRGRKGLSRHKAKKMCHESSVRGHKITDKQRRYFCWMANKSKISDIGPLCPPQQAQSGLIDYRQIRFGKELGRGAFGVVWSGTYMKKPVAIKTIQGQVTREAQTEFYKEANLLANIPPNKNIVKFIGITQNPLVLVTELVTGGDLESRLKPEKSSIKWSEIVRWAQGIANGMSHLHKYDILHRDLATRNVLLDSTGRAKVTDFGLSVRICSPQDRNLNYQQKEFFRGPYKWMPPESLAYQQFSDKSDVWSYGVTLWEILSRRAPFELWDIEFVKHHVINSRLRLPLPTRWPQVVKNIMSACWRTNPQDRPSMRRVLSWFGALKIADLNKSRTPAISNAEVRQLYQPASPIQEKEDELEKW